MRLLIGPLRDWLPILYLGVAAAAFALPPTRDLAITLQLENGLVEWATVLFLMIAVGACGVAAKRAAGRERALLILAAAAFFLVAGEEVAWGQWMFGPISESWAAANSQGETTLHNLTAIQGTGQLWYLVASVVAMAAMLPRPAAWLGIAAPARRLLPALAAVCAFAACRTAAATMRHDPRWDGLLEGVRLLSEYVESVIGWICFRYGWEVLRAQRSAGTSCETVAPAPTSIGSER